MFKDRHFDQSVIQLCVHWYFAYGLSLRDLKEMMAEGGIDVDHSTIHRWVVHFSPWLLKRFNRRKCAVTRKWHVDETYIKVRGSGCIFIARLTAPATPSSSGSVNTGTCRPERVVIDGSQTNREAIVSCDTENRLRYGSRRASKWIRIRKSRYLNNRIEQDHRRIKRRVRPMPGFTSFASATATLAGVEMIHMLRKRQARYAYNPHPSIAEQFEIIAAA